MDRYFLNNTPEPHIVASFHLKPFPAKTRVRGHLISCKSDKVQMQPGPITDNRFDNQPKAYCNTTKQAPRVSVKLELYLTLPSPFNLAL